MKALHRARLKNQVYVLRYILFTRSRAYTDTTRTREREREKGAFYYERRRIDIYFCSLFEFSMNRRADKDQQRRSVQADDKRKETGTAADYFFRRVLREVGGAVVTSVSLRSEIERRRRCISFVSGDECLPLSNWSSILSSNATRSAFRTPLGIVSPWAINRVFSSATVDASI